MERRGEGRWKPFCFWSKELFLEDNLDNIWLSVLGYFSIILSLVCSTHLSHLDNGPLKLREISIPTIW